MRRERSTRPTQRTAEGTHRTKPESVSKAHCRSEQGHHQEGARDGTRERLRQGLQLRNKREKGDRPLKGKDQAEREELSPTRSRRRITASAPAAAGRQENLRAEAEGSPEGEGSKPKKQPADRRQRRAGGPGSGPTTRGAQWRETRTPPQDPQLQ